MKKYPWFLCPHTLVLTLLYTFKVLACVAASWLAFERERKLNLGASPTLPLSRRSRFSRARNALPLSFQTPATQATNIHPSLIKVLGKWFLSSRGRKPVRRLDLGSRERKQRGRRRQRERRETNWFRLAKQLFTCSTLFCTFLYRHCTTTTSGREHKSTTLFFFFWTSVESCSTWKNCQHLTNPPKSNGTRAIKFEAAGFHFLSDVFIAVAVVVA